MRDLWKRSSLPRVWGMVWPAMDHPDSQLHQPDGERGEGVVEVAAPGGAIVYQYRVGHAVAAEDGGEMVMDGLSLLVCTGPHAQGEPRMVVQYRQWVAPSTTAYRDMPLEVHLPLGRWCSKRLYALCLRLSAGSISRCRLRIAVIVVLVGTLLCPLSLSILASTCPPLVGCSLRRSTTSCSISAPVRFGE